MLEIESKIDRIPDLVSSNKIRRVAASLLFIASCSTAGKPNHNSSKINGNSKTDPISTPSNQPNQAVSCDIIKDKLTRKITYRSFKIGSAATFSIKADPANLKSIDIIQYKSDGYAIGSTHTSLQNIELHHPVFQLPAPDNRQVEVIIDPVINQEMPFEFNVCNTLLPGLKVLNP